MKWPGKLGTATASLSRSPRTSPLTARMACYRGRENSRESPAGHTKRNIAPSTSG